jgi:hypothetical protein
MNDDEIKKYVREHYAEVATGKRTHIPAREKKVVDYSAPQQETNC